MAEPDSGPERDWTRPACILMALAAVVHLVLGVAALTGGGAFEANVREIESNPDFGRLYFGLGVWGAIVVGLSAAELAAAFAAARGSQNGWLAAMIVTFAGMTVSFFTLAIFHLVCLLAVVLLLAAAFLLAYHSRHSPRRR
jgi:hypothetical protein